MVRGWFYCVFYCVGLALGFAIVFAAVIGDLTSVSDPDYFWRLADMSIFKTAIVIAFAVLALTPFVIRVIKGGERASWSRVEAFSVLLAIFAGVILGYGFRVATQGVIGANIGAGIAILFMVPVSLCLCVFSVIMLHSLQHRQKLGH